MPKFKTISSGSSFETLAGYSRAIVDDDYVHVAGTTGYDYQTGTLSDDVQTQTRQCFENIRLALEQAGCTLDDVVRARYMLTDIADFETVAPLFGEYMGSARPAATAMIVGLIEPAMKIEIEVTARRPKL